MKWALASIALLLLIVVFSLAALDQKDAVWWGNTPVCPHCRATVRSYSVVCPECRHGFDWQSHDVECDACLSEHDAEYWLAGYDKKPESLDGALTAAGVPEEDRKDLAAYVESLRSGACGFCGGTGKWMARAVSLTPPPDEKSAALEETLRKQQEGACPVCFGSGRCVLCDGRHRTTVGREAAAVDLDVLRRSLDGLDRYRDAESAGLVYRLLRNYVRNQAGHAEIRDVLSFDRPGEAHLWRARERLSFVLKVLGSIGS